MLSLESVSGQQRSLGTEAVLPRSVVGREKDNEDKLLFFFVKSTSVDICFAFPDFGPLIVNDEIIERSIMQIARFNAWVVTVLACF